VIDYDKKFQVVWFAFLAMLFLITTAVAFSNGDIGFAVCFAICACIFGLIEIGVAADKIRFY
jgi:hypothetical protein